MVQVLVLHSEQLQEICSFMKDLETTIAEFKGVEAALTYSAGYTINVGLIPTLVDNKQDLIISDELNHGSIIDGVRLTKASRAVYPHNDTDALEENIKTK